MVAGSNPARPTIPFERHVELLQAFLANRDEIASQIEIVLNAQRRPAQHLRDRLLLTRLLDECFFNRAWLIEDQAALKGQLQTAHWDAGFKPQDVPGLHNDLIDPAEILMRGFHLWQRTRWPGHGGRMRCAQILFDLWMLRSLVLLSVRVCDAGADGASERLALVQALLDRLNDSTAGRPVFVRDARWLIPLAQSPTTDDLGAYLDLARQVAESLPADDGLEVQRAHVRINGGHLCSQIRHYCLKDSLTIDDRSVVVRTRTSNALDFSIAVQGLAALLAAYDEALHSGNDRRRFELAGSICQGISPDPEAFLQREELLRPYSMIEHVFVTTDGNGRAQLTDPGRRHLQLLEEYQARMRGLAPRLLEDCERLRPIEGACSPYGVIFGTASNLIEDMALKYLQSEAVTPFSLEDLFVDGDARPDKIAWVNGWRKLPHVDRKVQKLYEYPSQFATELFERVECTLRACVETGGSDGNAPARISAAAARLGRLFVEAADGVKDASMAPAMPLLPARFIRSSDPELVGGRLAQHSERAELLHDRQEGHFLVSYESAGGWVGIRKDFLTEVLADGQDARINGLPPVAAETLTLMCGGLVVPASVTP